MGAVFIVHQNGFLGSVKPGTEVQEVPSEEYSSLISLGLNSEEGFILISLTRRMFW